MKITNQTLARRIEVAMALELGALNLLKRRTKSPLTVENVFKWRDCPNWELEAELETLDRELTGHLRHIRPAAEADVRKGYAADYFEKIEKCFEDVPRDLRPDDVVLKGEILSYSDRYRSARIAAATVELTEPESAICTAIAEARASATKLKQLCGSSLWNGEMELLVFCDRDTQEVAFDYVEAARRREKYSNIKN